MSPAGYIGKNVAFFNNGLVNASHIFTTDQTDEARRVILEFLEG
jgi:hypothetical protein